MWRSLWLTQHDHLCTCVCAGTAPSHELLEIWNTRESSLVEAGENSLTLGGILHTRPLGE